MCLVCRKPRRLLAVGRKTYGLGRYCCRWNARAALRTRRRHSRGADLRLWRDKRLRYFVLRHPCFLSSPFFPPPSSSLQTFFTQPYENELSVSLIMLAFPNSISDQVILFSYRFKTGPYLVFILFLLSFLFTKSCPAFSVQPSLLSSPRTPLQHLGSRAVFVFVFCSICCNGLIKTYLEQSGLTTCTASTCSKSPGPTCQAC